MRVFFFGASGGQGAAQVAMLAHASHYTVAVSRSPNAIKIDGQSTETAAADFNNNNAAIARGLEGAEVVFLNLTSTSLHPAEPIIVAARASGVRLLAFNTSMPVPETPQDTKTQDDRCERRRLHRQSDVPFISIQPVVCVDNLLQAGRWHRSGPQHDCILPQAHI
ncbi:hypothetical protein K432DRAFT_410455 [Lepidopterella palustris CBS 459.81]|uniref:NAD(P)-binding domain-containing protein n=1 Tax=Lepidopterella palustris CBS 459.81 TaxID=1314670 RepID=A0A8E2DXS4_9PEZI|nr:hypothetical protein K432DRAFT_410455 [Lepidopterella palustris CBS 459.81]